MINLIKSNIGPIIGKVCDLILFFAAFLMTSLYDIAIQWVDIPTLEVINIGNMPEWLKIIIGLSIAFYFVMRGIKKKSK